MYYCKDNRGKYDDGYICNDGNNEYILYNDYFVKDISLAGMVTCEGKRRYIQVGWKGHSRDVGWTNSDINIIVYYICGNLNAYVKIWNGRHHRCRTMGAVVVQDNDRR